MEVEGVRNFKELRAKFQNTVDAPLLPGPIKFPAGVSQKDDITSTLSTQVLANGKLLSSNQNQLSPYCSSNEPEPLTPQKMKLAQNSKFQKCSNSPAPLKGSTGSTINSQKASLLSEMNQSNDEITDKEKVKVSDSFRNKLWNWEKFSSQKSEMSSAILLANCGGRAFYLEEQKVMGRFPEKPKKKLETNEAQILPSQRHLMAQRKSLAFSEDSSFLLSQHKGKTLENPSSERRPARGTSPPIYECELASQVTEKQQDIRHHQLPRTKPLPSVESLGPPPTKPPKPPVVNLQAFQRQAAAILETQREAAGEDSNLPPESAEFEDPHNYEATISYLRHSGNAINLCTTEEIADSIYEVGIEELQKPWKSFLNQELSPKHEDEDKKMKENDPCKLEPQKIEKHPHVNQLFKMGASEGTPGKLQMTEVHKGKRTMPPGKQDSVTDVIQTKACPEDPKLARHTQGHCGYVEALEVTKETPDQGAFMPSSTTEEMYDDVDYPERERTKSLSSNSFASDSEENSEEIYEDVYNTKSDDPKIDLDGNEALKRLRQFFKKEKDRFKMKKDKSKENLSEFSISLPDIEFRSRKVKIYDDVDIPERKSKEEDKLKTWKTKFLIPKENKGKKAAEESESLSPRNFFRIKKQNLEKKMEKEEKLFRERFEYDKEITVINTAVACSSNSRRGIFDLPITPGEELEVIDITEQNLVICRNSEGKYGYVLTEHLDFKHQSWSP
ncbi:FYN-binding protein 2 [Trichechus inunguis]